MKDIVHKVLIVDDEPNIRTVFRTALEGDDCVVSTCEDGESALRWLRQFPADLVLLDLNMPGAGGVALLRGLRNEGVTVPVVIVTAHGSIPDAVEAMKLGAIDFLAKPLAPDALRQTVRGVLERHEGVDPDPLRTRGERPQNLLTSAKRALNHRLFDRAALLLREVIKENSDLAEPWYLLGLIHEGQHQHHVAANDYETALQLEPGHRFAEARLRELSAR